MRVAFIDKQFNVTWREDPAQPFWSVMRREDDWQPLGTEVWGRSTVYKDTYTRRWIGYGVAQVPFYAIADAGWPDAINLFIGSQPWLCVAMFAEAVQP